MSEQFLIDHNYFLASWPAYSLPYRLLPKHWFTGSDERLIFLGTGCIDAELIEQ